MNSLRCKTPIVGIILAAGSGRRFKDTKLLQPIDDELLINRVIQAAFFSRLDRVAVVIGHQALQFRRILSPFSGRKNFSVIENPDYAEGMSSSIKAGLRHVMQQHPSAMFMLGDMPGISVDIIDGLIDRFLESDHEICLPVYKGLNGHPVLFSRSFYSEILKLQGDIGARGIIPSFSGSVLRVPVNDPAVITDIDTPHDLKVFLRQCN